MTAAQAMPLAKAAAEKAIELDDTSAEAYTSLGVFKETYEFDWAGSEREFHRALALNPNYAFAHDQFGSTLAWQGRLDEALAQNRSAAELDPLSPEIMADSVVLLTWQGKYQAATEQAYRGLDLDRTFFLLTDEIGWIDIEAGKISDAIPDFRKPRRWELPRSSPQISVTRMGLQATASKRAR